MDMQSGDWVLSKTSTIYMDGTSVFHLHRFGKPGIIGTVALRQHDAEDWRNSLWLHDQMIQEKAWAEGADAQYAVSGDRISLSGSNPYSKE